MSALDLAVDALAATRLTRLVVEDSFPPVQALRDRIVARHATTKPVYQAFDREDGLGREDRVVGQREVPDAWAELITCPWCAGMWICLGVVVARKALPRAWQPLAKALAFSMVAGLIESKVDT